MTVNNLQNINIKWNYNMVRVACSFMLQFTYMGMIQSFGLVFSEILHVFQSNKLAVSWIPSINAGIVGLSGEGFLFYS